LVNSFVAAERGIVVFQPKTKALIVLLIFIIQCYRLGSY
jgi:hypothetical protein